MRLLPMSPLLGVGSTGQLHFVDKAILKPLELQTSSARTPPGLRRENRCAENSAGKCSSGCRAWRQGASRRRPAYAERAALAELTKQEPLTAAFLVPHRRTWQNSPPQHHSASRPSSSAGARASGMASSPAASTSARGNCLVERTPSSFSISACRTRLPRPWESFFIALV